MSKRGRLLALATLLNATGCLRFAYEPVDRDAGSDAGAGQLAADAGSQKDAEPPAAGSGAGVGGRSSGAGGKAGAAVGGSGGSRALADAGMDAGYSGRPDASITDAGIADAAMPAAGSGGTGGAGGAGGAAGSGGAGGASEVASCVPGSSGVLFCNGFETDKPWAPSPAPWDTELLTDATDDRNPMTKKHGEASGHFTVSKDSGVAGVASSRFGNISSGDLWLRYYYYIPSGVVINASFSTGVLSEVSAPHNGFALSIYPTVVQIASSLKASQQISYTFPRDTWVCVEHHAVIHATAGYFEVYFDGVRKVQTSTGNTLPAGGYGSAEVGVHALGQNQSPVNVYVDDVVVSTTQFGCN